MLKNWRTYLAAVLLLSGLALSFYARESSAAFQKCYAAQNANYAAQEQKEGAPHIGVPFFQRDPVAFNCTGAFIDENSATITALATIAIAAFTLTLWLTTGQAIKLARAEFLASNRPKILIHVVEAYLDFSADSQNPNIQAHIHYFNAGGAGATIVEISGKITPRKIPLQSGIDLPVIRETVGKIPTGMGGSVRMDSECDERTARIADPEVSIVCIGRIIYADDLGNRRRTGFCRRYDRKTERWVKEDNPEYEYAY